MIRRGTLICDGKMVYISYAFDQTVPVQGGLEEGGVAAPLGVVLGSVVPVSPRSVLDHLRHLREVPVRVR